MSIKAIIFDCFGVLYHGARSYVLDQSPDGMRSRVDELFDQADYGLITTAEFVAQVAEAMGTTTQEVESMLSSQFQRNEVLVSRLEHLRTSYKVALLSNVNDTLIHKLFHEDELERFFDVIVMSSSVGMVKPNPEIFELTAHRLSVDPAECIMVDDIPSNIDGARAAGMDGVVCASTSQCLADLRSKGVAI